MKKSKIAHRFESEDKIPLFHAFVGMFVIFAVISIAIGVSLLANKSREQKVITRYTKETTEFITKNKTQMLALFTSTMDSCKQQLLEAQATVESNSTRPTDIICTAGQEQLTKMQVSELKDSSAIAYVRATNGSYELLEASGKYNESRSIKGNSYQHFSYNKRNDLEKYFITEDNLPIWGDYISYIRGKEVIVPVKSENGTTIGYIFRGVIER